MPMLHVIYVLKQTPTSSSTEWKKREQSLSFFSYFLLRPTYRRLFESRNVSVNKLWYVYRKIVLVSYQLNITGRSRRT